MLSESLIHNLGDGQVIEVCLSADGFNPATFNMEGGALGLSAGIARLEQGRFALLPPVDDLLQGRYQTDNHVIVDRRYTLGGHVWRRGEYRYVSFWG
jgi:hypothetical protein